MLTELYAIQDSKLVEYVEAMESLQIMRMRVVDGCDVELEMLRARELAGVMSAAVCHFVQPHCACVQGTWAWV